jgi:hypothetical protein
MPIDTMTGVFDDHFSLDRPGVEIHTYIYVMHLHIEPKSPRVKILYLPIPTGIKPKLRARLCTFR